MFIETCFLRVLGLLCPNTQTILVEYADTAFYKSLSQEMDFGNFVKLTTVPIPFYNSSEIIEAYKNVLSAMRSNVENLYKQELHLKIS
jgi:hypothetical protein